MIQHDYKQGSPEWLAHRRDFWNASDAPAMLGLSKYKSRTELLHEYHTGLAPEVDSATQKVFDDGHRFEELARPIAEEIIGQDLYRLVGSEGKYGASFDGLTLGIDINWENKTLNNEIRACKFADDLDEMYLVQMEQQHMVSGCERTLFTGTKFDNEGNLLEKVEFWYVSRPERRQRIIDGWNQFAIDLANYVPVEVIKKPKAATIMALPSLAIQIKGEVTLSNLPEFKEAATAYIASISTTFITDEDFSNGEATITFCESAEKNIELTKNAAIAQTASIDELMRALDFIKGQLRDKRLIIEKLVKAEKENRKQEIVIKAREAFAAHLQSHYPTRLKVDFPDFGCATKNKKTLTSMKEAVNQMLVNSKIEIDLLARDINRKTDWFKDIAENYEFLFADLQEIIYKENDDFQLLVNSRIKTHKETEAAKEAAMKARAEAEARAKVESETLEAARIATMAAAASLLPTMSNEEVKKHISQINIAEPVSKINKETRPSDDQIIEVLALHYRVHESSVIAWLLDMDLNAASERMATEFKAA